MTPGEFIEAYNGIGAKKAMSPAWRLLGLAGPMDRAVFLFFWAVVAPLPAGRGGL